MEPVSAIPSPGNIPLPGAAAPIQAMPTAIAPTTTAEQNTTTAGQRVVNLIWEKTQSQIAKICVYVGLAVNSVVIIVMVFPIIDITIAKLAVISACLSSINLTVGIVIGFYFSRTNHTKVGGVGDTTGKER